MAKLLGVDESILGSSSVYLFGRVLSDMKVVFNDPSDSDRPKRRGNNNFLVQQLRSKQAKLARIFSFAFEGTFYELARPAIFLVHGNGDDPDAPPPPSGDFERLARSPGRITRNGVGRHFGSFAMDMKVWVYDKADLSLRLDVESGAFEQILLEAEIAAEDDAGIGGGFGRSSGGRSSGAMGRSSGGRSSGAMGRSSGWMPRKTEK
ncbi:hypothetical protein [Mesorhizobium sp. 10J20-29]